MTQQLKVIRNATENKNTKSQLNFKRYFSHWGFLYFDISTTLYHSKNSYNNKNGNNLIEHITLS